MSNFIKGDKIVVTDGFDWDGTTFLPGMTGTVLKMHNRNDRQIVSIEWDHDDRANFHSCGGLCPSYRGYNLDVEKANLALASEINMGNPLPDDPRLRGICIKIKQMETRFKLRQERKKSQEVVYDF